MARAAARPAPAERAAAGLCVRLLYLGGGAFLAPGEIRWDARGRIVALRRARGRAADLAVFPGLVDAHVHLQLPPLPGPRGEPAERGFLAWLRAVLALQRAAPPGAQGAQGARARAALRELAQGGTTAVGEIDASGASPAALRRVPLAGRCYRELTGFHLAKGPAHGLVAAQRLPGSRRCPAGLSPHAPYSVSAALFRAAAARSAALSVHTAEVPAEQELLHTGRGPFAELLAELGRMPERWRAPRVGAVRHLQRLGVLRRGTQLVHCQELERGDRERIAASGAAITVCPGTMLWFLREPPPVPAWLGAGIPVSLGTDSRASNDGLSMLAELARAAGMWPGLAPATLFAMATAHGAAALGRPGLGRLRRGGPADFLAVRPGGASPAQVLAALVHGELPVAGTWLRGRRLAGAPGRPVVEPV